MLLTENVRLADSKQVFRSTQIPLVTDPKGNSSQFYKSQLCISDINKNSFFFFFFPRARANSNAFVYTKICTEVRHDRHGLPEV